MVHGSPSSQLAPGAAALAQAIRDYGHLDVQLDPLGTPPHGAPELHPAFYEINDAVLESLPVDAVPWPVVPESTTAKQAITDLRRVYSGGIGYDFDQVQIAEERAWLRENLARVRMNLTASLDARLTTRELLELTPGTVLSLGIPVEMFTPMFAIARTVGWISHWMEMISDPSKKIGRPRQLYIGAAKRDVPAISAR